MTAIVIIIVVVSFVTVSNAIMPSLFRMVAFPAAVAFVKVVVEAIFAIVPGYVLVPVVFSVLRPVMFQ